MTLEYELTLEDMLEAGTLFYPEPSSARYLKTRVGYSLWMGLLVFLFLCCVTAREEPANAALVGLVFAFAWFLVIPSWYRRALRRQLATYFSGDSNRLLRGDRSFEISEQGFVVRGSESEQSYAWTAIQHVSVTKEFDLVYVAAIQMHVIPRVRVTGDVSVDAFLTKMRRFVPEVRFGSTSRWQPSN